MNEHEWLACKDPTLLLNAFRSLHEPSERKLRLFAVACCQRVWDLLVDERSRDAVTAAERFAEGQMADHIREEFFGRALAAANELLDAAYAARNDQDEHSLVAEAAVNTASWTGAFLRHDGGAYPAAASAASAARDRQAERAVQSRLVRDVLGNPFRPVTFDPAWRTPTVTAVAQTIYTERRFADLPILADALEEAGCTSADILEHLRSSGEHFRGCWALDLVLGKE